MGVLCGPHFFALKINGLKKKLESRKPNTGSERIRVYLKK